jgi:MFS family permease
MPRSPEPCFSGALPSGRLGLDGTASRRLDPAVKPDHAPSREPLRGVAVRVGARPLLTGGCLTAATGFVLLSLSPGNPSYVLDVLPGVTLMGFGLAMTVAPPTGTVLAAAPDELAGTASGVNNAVARTAGLMAVAALPVIVGLSGSQYADPNSLAPAYRTALLVCDVAMAASAALTVVGLSGTRVTPPADSIGR